MLPMVQAGPTTLPRPLSDDRPQAGRPRRDGATRKRSPRYRYFRWYEGAMTGRNRAEPGA